MRGYWADEGIDVRIALSPAPAETAETLLDGRADVAWGGPMRVMMYHDRDPSCPLVCFGQIVERDPFVLVGRNACADFQFSRLIGQRLAVARDVPTPWMTFQDDLGRAGISESDLTLVDTPSMAAASEGLASGEIDVAQLLEPHATQAIQADAHLWHRFATRGPIGYTAFYSTREFVAAETETCRALLRGLDRALVDLMEGAADELAGELFRYLPDWPPELVAYALAGYRASGLWPRHSAPSLPAFVRLKAALLSGGLIGRDLPFDHLFAALETS